MTDSLQVILNKAADLIDERGLAKGVFKDKEGHLCAWGAIGEAVEVGGAHLGSNVLSYRERTRIRECLVIDDSVIKALGDSRYREDLSAFNDSDYVRSKSQVSALLRRIAKRIES